MPALYDALTPEEIERIRAATGPARWTTFKEICTARGLIANNQWSTWSRLHLDFNSPPPAAAPDVPAWAQESAGEKVTDKYWVPASPVDKFDGALRATGDRLLIFDTHFPTHNAPLLSEALEMADRLKIGRYIIGGDLFSNDQWRKQSLGQHQDRRWQDDVDLSEKVFERIHAVLDGGEVIKGNHDEWLTDYLRRQADDEWLFNRLIRGVEGRVSFSSYDRMILTSADEQFMVAHGANYSSPNPLGVPRDLAAQFGMHVATGHQHHHEQGRDKSGRFQVLACGPICDFDRIAYYQQRTRRGMRMSNGYAVIKGGYMQGFEPAALARRWH